ISSVVSFIQSLALPASGPPSRPEVASVLLCLLRIAQSNNQDLLTSKYSFLSVLCGMA
ncbi:hypothetical protein KIPB_016990, partial [Kipferlia bialata]